MGITNTLSEFEDKFHTRELVILDTKHWTWSLRPSQVTIGSGILSLKRECFALSNVSIEEFCDLKAMIKVIEQTLFNAFEYQKINYMMLMMLDKQLHYHVIPRYENMISFNSSKWIDTSWPSVPDLGVEVSDMSELITIKKYLEEKKVL